MTTFITISQTPVYKVMPNGSYSFVRSIAEGTELTFARTGVDPLSKRQVGFFATGEVMYLDALSALLAETEVRATRLWDWLLWLGLAGTAGYVGYRQYKKVKGKKLAK